MSPLPSFAELSRRPEPELELLALAIAAEFREVDGAAAVAALDAAGEDLARSVAETSGDPAETARACGRLLGGEYGFAGDREGYDEPDNSMLDLVLARRRGLPILLSIVYVAAARRAGVPLAGVGLPGHFVVGHFGTDPPVLLDPFNGGVVMSPPPPPATVRPWHPHAIATRMLNNLVASYERRGNLGSAIRAARMRLALPTYPGGEGLRTAMTTELRALQARLN